MVAEQRGIPAMAVMTEQFVSAAELMSRVLGAEDYSFLTTAHPISSATPDQLAERGRQAAAACATHLVVSIH